MERNIEINFYYNTIRKKIIITEEEFCINKIIQESMYALNLIIKESKSKESIENNLRYIFIDDDDDDDIKFEEDSVDIYIRKKNNKIFLTIKRTKIMFIEKIKENNLM